MPMNFSLIASILVADEKINRKEIITRLNDIVRYVAIIVYLCECFWVISGR